MDGGGEGGGLHKINVNVDFPFNTCSSAVSFVFFTHMPFIERAIFDEKCHLIPDSGCLVGD